MFPDFPDGRWLRLTALVGLFMSSVLFVLPAPSVHAATDARGVAVALGDSFVSGEAGRWLGNSRGGGPSANGTDRMCILRWWGCELRAGGVYRDGPTEGCHRSDTAAIETLTTDFERRINLACSGAIARDISRPAERGPASGLPSQADRLESVASHHRVSMVLLAIGANDIGFSDLVADCAEAWFAARPGGCRRPGGVSLSAGLASLRRQVGNAVVSVVSAMTRSGYSREEWDFVVHGYASPLPRSDGFRYPENSVRRLLPGGCPFTDADADWSDSVLVSTLNRELRRIAEARGARFLDLSHAFDGHRVCEQGSELVGSDGPSGRSAEWFRFLVPCCGLAKRESLHPNAYGQRAIGTCLDEFITKGSGGWSCRNRPGSGPGSMRLVGL